MIKINVATDFSKTPGGRAIAEGRFSGEDFRINHLLPKYKQAKDKNDILEIDLDGCYGFPTSFLEEAFGGLARELKSNSIMESIKITCIDEPSIIREIEGYVREAKWEK